MSFNVTDLMIQVLPEETWYACTCTVGTNQQCGQCTDVTGDDLDKGDDDDKEETQTAAPANPAGGGERAAARPGAYELAALQEQLRRALARQAGD